MALSLCLLLVVLISSHHHRPVVGGSVPGEDDCMNVPVDYESICQRELTVRQPYQCVKTVVRPQCVQRAVSRTIPCSKTGSRWVEYDCVKPHYNMSCVRKQVQTPSKCKQSIVEQVAYDCTTEMTETECKPEGVLLERTCQRLVTRDESYPCLKEEEVDVCDNVPSETTPATCFNNNVEQVAFDCPADTSQVVSCTAGPLQRSCSRVELRGQSYPCDKPGGCRRNRPVRIRVACNIGECIDEGVCYRANQVREPYPCHKPKAGIECRRGKVTRESVCTKPVDRHESHMCSTTQPMQLTSCKPIVKQIKGTCYKDVSRDISYPCLKTHEVEDCTPSLSQQAAVCYRKVDFEEPNMCVSNELMNQCEDVEKTVQTICYRDAPHNQHYKCTKQTMRKQCGLPIPSDASIQQRTPRTTTSSQSLLPAPPADNNKALQDGRNSDRQTTHDRASPPPAHNPTPPVSPHHRPTGRLPSSSATSSRPSQPIPISLPANLSPVSSSPSASPSPSLHTNASTNSRSPASTASSPATPTEHHGTSRQPSPVSPVTADNPITIMAIPDEPRLPTPDAAFLASFGPGLLDKGWEPWLSTDLEDFNGSWQIDLSRSESVSPLLRELGFTTMARKLLEHFPTTTSLSVDRVQRQIGGATASFVEFTSDTALPLGQKKHMVSRLDGVPFEVSDDTIGELKGRAFYHDGQYMQYMMQGKGGGSEWLKVYEDRIILVSDPFKRKPTTTAPSGMLGGIVGAAGEEGNGKWMLFKWTVHRGGHELVTAHRWFRNIDGRTKNKIA
eukprot:GHVS01023674.1.p1 GENE.GHVS01023674.1~~GHVS01023674.1.p1  ORF type:complete len:797 (-),score=101.58 GHVS01023674.1:406-2757(-)